MKFSVDELHDAAALVHAHVPPTPQHVWPLLTARTGAAEVRVKHENHAPTSAFKVRGGVTYIDWLRRAHPEVRGICTATRGNHGQSQARAAVAAGLQVKVFVPRGNSVEKNAAMRGYGAEVVEHGTDFDAARVEALRVAEAEGLTMVPSFHEELVRGVATYGLELFTAAPDLDTVYVPIGLGSGICGTIMARDALGLATKIVGVVAENAAGAKLSVEAGRVVETNTCATFADGMSVRIPSKEAFDIYSKSAERVVSVSEDEIAEAMRIYYQDTHNLAEGAGAAPLAALMQERDRMAGKRVGLVLSGGNVDASVFARVLGGVTPAV
ncbi:Threonine dehydratase [Candidatus Rhodobacter oscarellae]|uniref:Threonine dehydratase n=1 Tax=Candidatus Rhodobacter oscarellae TaxID=1675527 RepID=A0A0J9E9X9_9RHOB|nr:threonine dehydratase [Candidatus Rhodobacter lobularis]KMW59602.1 Threonine dehydratase [Candidatus Rhodobacter lobularis]